jgi:hypothetical protein
MLGHGEVGVKIGCEVRDEVSTACAGEQLLNGEGGTLLHAEGVTCNSRGQRPRFTINNGFSTLKGSNRMRGCATLSGSGLI